MFVCLGGSYGCEGRKKNREYFWWLWKWRGWGLWGMTDKYTNTSTSCGTTQAATVRLQPSDLSYCRTPTLAGMAGVGKLHRLFRAFLILKTTCKKASLRLYSDGSNCQVTLRVTAPGKGYQTPRRGSGPSRSQEAAPGTLATSSPPAAPTVTAATAPALTRRVRRHGPGALLRDKRRGLSRIEPTLLLSDPASPPPCSSATRCCNARGSSLLLAPARG